MKKDEFVEVKSDDPVSLLKHLAEMDAVDRKAKYDIRQSRLNIVTQFLTTITVWLFIGAVALFAVWGIVVALDLILKALGIK